MDNDEIAQLRAEVAELKKQVTDSDTQVNALEQAIEALRKSEKANEKASVAVETAAMNKNQIDRLFWLYGRLEIIAKTAICVGIGWASMAMVAVPMINDELPGNDFFANCAMVTAIGCVAYGIGVLTGNEGRVLSVIEAVNPWSRR